MKLIKDLIVSANDRFCSLLVDYYGLLLEQEFLL